MIFVKDQIGRAQLLPQKPLKQDYVTPKLKSSIQKLYGHHYDLVDRYEISISSMLFFYHCQDLYRTVCISRRALFAFLSFIFWSLYRLSFVDSWFLITPFGIFKFFLQPIKYSQIKKF
jgi:hypothetical protein